MTDRSTAQARVSDPESSHLAAAEVEINGIAGAQRMRCLEAVIAHPGKTAAEIAVMTGLERHAPSRRLPDLRRAGLVRMGDQRQCSVKNRLSVTWWPRVAHG